RERLDALNLVGHFDEPELACDGGFELVTARRFAGAAAIDGIDDVAVLRHHLRPEVGDVDPLVDDGPGAAAGRRSAIEVDDRRVSLSLSHVDGAQNAVAEIQMV